MCWTSPDCPSGCKHRTARNADGKQASMPNEMAFRTKHPNTKEDNTMMMTMNEKKTLFAFGCPKRELTVARLRHAAALAVDPAAKKAFFSLALKLNEDATDEEYRNFYYNMRLDMEYGTHHKYVPDNQPVPVDMPIRDYHKSVKQRIREQQMRTRRMMK